MSKTHPTFMEALDNAELRNERELEDTQALLDRQDAVIVAVISACREELATGSAVGSAQTLARKILALCGEE